MRREEAVDVDIASQVVELVTFKRKSFGLELLFFFQAVEAKPNWHLNHVTIQEEVEFKGEIPNH